MTDVIGCVFFAWGTATVVVLAVVGVGELRRYLERREAEREALEFTREWAEYNARFTEHVR